MLVGYVLGLVGDGDSTPAAPIPGGISRHAAVSISTLAVAVDTLTKFLNHIARPT